MPPFFYVLLTMRHTHAVIITKPTEVLGSRNFWRFLQQICV